MYRPPERELSAEERKLENQRYIESYAQAVAAATPAERELAQMDMADGPTDWTRRRQLEQIVKQEAAEREDRAALEKIAALPQRATADCQTIFATGGPR